MVEIETKRVWFRCKKCNKKLFLYSNIANCNGVYEKCKNCGYENNVKIKSGKVI